MPAPRRRSSSRESGRTLGNVEANLKKSARKYKSAGWVKIPDGESAIVRVIDVGNDFRDGFVHPVEFERKGGSSFTRDVMCLDQDDDGTPCPGCRDDLDRRFKFWCRVIEREAPKTNDSGKVIGYEDEVKILSSGKRLVGALEKKHHKRDLALRDIEIEREGTGWDTDYSVEWVDEEDAPLTEDELKLVEESDVDLDRYTTVPDFDDFYELPSQDGDNDREKPGERAKRGSPFAGKKSQANSDNDDDDADDKPRRRSSQKPGGLAGIKAKKTPGGSTGKTIKRRRTS